MLAELPAVRRVECASAAFVAARARAEAAYHALTGTRARAVVDEEPHELGLWLHAHFATSGSANIGMTIAPTSVAAVPECAVWVLHELANYLDRRVAVSH